MVTKKLCSLLLCICLLCSAVGFAQAEEKADTYTGFKDVTLDLFLNMTWMSNSRMQWTGIIPEAITERTGVKLQTTVCLDDQELGMMMAGGELPDLIFTDKPLDRLSSSKFCYSYNELIEQYGLDWEPDPQLIQNSRLYSGTDDYYMLLTTYYTQEQLNVAHGIPNLPTLLVRDDILDELGNPPMETLDDFMNVLGMVKEKYPDLVPYMPADYSNWGNDCFRAYFHMPSAFDYVEQEDGSIIHYTQDENYEDYVRYLNTMYRKGYTPADAYSLDGSSKNSALTNGQYFSYANCTDGKSYASSNTLQQAVPNGRIGEHDFLSEGDKFYSEGIGWAGVFISKNCKNPEAAIRFMQFMFSEEGKRLSQWGREGIEWTLGADGLPVYSDEWVEASLDMDLMTSKYQRDFYISSDGIVEMEGRIAPLPKELQDYYLQTLKPHIYVCPWLGASVPRGGIDEVNVYNRVAEVSRSGEVSIILSESDEEFERNLETLRSNLEQVGIDKLLTYMTEQAGIYRELY